MKKIIIAFLLSFVICHSSFAQIGTWHNYLAYAEIQQIQSAGDDLFVMANNGLYQYNKTDQSIVTYDKTNGLNDVYITLIRWCPQVKRLVVVYDNANIDLVETNGNVINISDIYTKSITGGKTIHNITIHNQYAYLSTDYGISKVNVKNVEISESYMLGFTVNAVVIEGNTIYAKSDDNGVWKAAMSANLIDPANWTQTSDYPSFEEDLKDYNNNIELVKTLSPGGPTYNKFYESKFYNGKLYSTGGTFLPGQRQDNNPGIVQIFDGTNWTVYPTDINETTGYNYEDINCIDIDPTDNNHVMIGGRCGLYEFQNGTLKAYYNKSNSPLRPVGSEGNYLSDDYTLVNGIKYDQQGNLWVTNSLTDGVNLLTLNKDGQWTSHTKSELYYEKTTTMPALRRLMFDSRGWMWFVNSHYFSPSILCYHPSTDQIIKYSSFTNQDGTTYSSCYPYDITEDNSGNIWIATNRGPFYIKSDEVGKSNATIYQEKVPRNDGTNLADYLLAGIFCNTIAVDGGGRKWIGTNGMGAFLISEDNYTQVQHFTIDNSPILSNNIDDIVINQQSGEVFFLTDKGLCSYVSDAIESQKEMSKETVWAYPNPVNPNYNGLITVVGLTENADVKILAANGALIAQGRSNGGIFTWDGNDMNGQRVASGVYMVATATKDGNKGTVCKIAIVR